MKAMVSVVLISIFLVGCTLSHEEYTERVKYCEDRGLSAKDVLLTGGGVHTVECINSEGVVFKSKRG